MTINSTPPTTDCWYVTGPTASGKTQIGLQLAAHLDAEIISLDSMAVYQQMKIDLQKQVDALPEEIKEVLEEDFRAQFVSVQKVNPKHLKLEQ